MWVSEQQRLHFYFTKLVDENKLGKLSAAASEVGMTFDEFCQKISISPRIPLMDGEYVKVAAFLMEKNPELFQQYLQEKYCNMRIRIE